MYHHKTPAHVHISAIYQGGPVLLTHLDTEVEFMWEPEDPWRVHAQIKLPTNDGGNKYVRWDLSVEHVTDIMHGGVTPSEMRTVGRAYLASNGNPREFVALTGLWDFPEFVTDARRGMAEVGLSGDLLNDDVLLQAGIVDASELERLVSNITKHMPNEEARLDLMEQSLQALLRREN